MVVDLFSYGWINPVLAVVMSTLGTLLAILLAIKARSRAGRGRGRLLVYASIALGGVGVFQAQLLGLLGFGVGGLMVRYDPLTLLAAAGGAIIVVGAGIAVVSFGPSTSRRTSRRASRLKASRRDSASLAGSPMDPTRVGTTRLIAASLLVGLGIIGTNAVMVSGMRGTDDLYYEPIRMMATIAIGLLAGCANIWFIVAVRGLRSAVLAATISGVAVCGMHYTSLAAIQAEPSLRWAVDGSQPMGGYLPMLLLAPVVLGGAAFIAMLWFFTVGASTMHDLRAIFDDPENSVEIEPWMIAEVTSRVASGPRRNIALIASAGRTPLKSESPELIGETTTVGERFGAPMLTASVLPSRYPPGYRPELTATPHP